MLKARTTPRSVRTSESGECDVTKSRIYLASLAACGAALTASVVLSAQMDLGPKVEKTYGAGLPRDRDTLVFSDDQYPVWPLTPEQKAYASINGARMKQQVIDLEIGRAHV